MILKLPLQVTHPQAVGIVKASFSALGFGLPPGTTDMDMAEILKSKGYAFGCSKYQVLGFCSPSHASRALNAEPGIGVLLPCNVAIAASEGGAVEVAAMDPSVMLALVENTAEIEPLIVEIRQLIQQAMDNVESSAGAGVP